MPQPVEERTRQIGRELFARARELGSGEPWLDRVLMYQGMRDERVKAELFRFVDVLPALSSNEHVTGHLKEYLVRACGAVLLERGLCDAESVDARVDNLQRVLRGAVAEVCLRAVAHLLVP